MKTRRAISCTGVPGLFQHVSRSLDPLLRLGLRRKVGRRRIPQCTIQNRNRSDFDAVRRLDPDQGVERQAPSHRNQNSVRTRWNIQGHSPGHARPISEDRGGGHGGNARKIFALRSGAEYGKDEGEDAHKGLQSGLGVP